MYMTGAFVGSAFMQTMVPIYSLSIFLSCDKVVNQFISRVIKRRC